MSKFNLGVIKNSVLGCGCMAAVGALILLGNTFFSSPDFNAFKLVLIEGQKSLEIKPVLKKTSSAELSEYSLVGFRAAKRNASVVLQKGNEQYVLQLGDSLEGMYQLHSVSKDKIEFMYKGSILSLPNTLTQ
tara:strand:- start:222 stop:617 length:396 start_codon:yes stop_codon:yes gene_type:complete